MIKQVFVIAPNPHYKLDVNHSSATPLLYGQPFKLNNDRIIISSS